MKKKHETQTTKMCIRIHPKDKNRLKQEAEDSGISLSLLVKYRALGPDALKMKTTRPKPSKDMDDLRRLFGELGKIGSNINQLAHHANRENNSIDSRMLNKAINALLKMRKPLIVALGGTRDQEK